MIYYGHMISQYSSVDGSSLVMKKVAIVIPVYNEIISSYELISLQQLNRVLGDYDKFFVAPENMIFSYADFCQDWTVENFKKYYFQNTVTYSELLLSEEFYDRFSQYEYMLIYQLDAFVFSDRLMEFCSLGYDYIGAPWPMNHRYSIGRRAAKIGNGGLSLRKIDSVIKLLRCKESIVRENNLNSCFLRVEDYFFTYCGSVSEIDFCVPDVLTARKFAIDFPTDLRYFVKTNLSQGMPFAFHGWNKFGSVYYTAKFINEAGYAVHEDDPYDYEKMYRTYMSLYFVDRCMKYRNNILPGVIKEMLKKEVIIWGGGTFGIKLWQVLKYYNMPAHCIFDRVPENIDDKTIPVLFPDEAIILSKRYVIVISPFVYEDVIAEDLTVKGLKEGIDFIKYSYLADRIIKLYFHALFR